MRGLDIINCDYRPLSKEQNDHFEEVVNYLKYPPHSWKRPLRLFRGDNFRAIARKLSRDEVDDGEILQRLFFIGDKARNFLIDYDQENEPEHMVNINDCSDETMAFIFDRIRNVLNAPPSSILASKAIECTSNSFRNFFQDGNNQQKFVRKIQNCLSPLGKIHLRDYYLFFLHTAGSRGVRGETFFVSTSRNKKIAELFARHQGKNGRSEDRAPIIFHYYVPYPYSRFAISPNSFASHYSYAARQGMHTFDSAGLFSDQQEVSVKGALFPHFILGIEYPIGSRFVVNPHLWQTPADHFAKRGCTINQADFSNWIELTNYRHYGEHSNRRHFTQFRVRARA